jgi:tetratricopeptide (TPR) repeat protein
MFDRVVGAEIPGDLAEEQVRMGNLAEAELLIKECIGVREKVQGESHADLVEDLLLLAEIAVQDRRYADAIPCYDRVLQIWRRVRGDTHSDVAQACRDLGEVYHSDGRRRGCRAMFRGIAGDQPQAVRGLQP